MFLGLPWNYASINTPNRKCIHYNHDIIRYSTIVECWLPSPPLPCYLEAEWKVTALKNYLSYITSLGKHPNSRYEMKLLLNIYWFYKVEN